MIFQKVFRVFEYQIQWMNITPIVASDLQEGGGGADGFKSNYNK